MPMVGTADRDDIDILASDQVEIIFAGERRAAERGLGLIAHIAIDVTHRGNIAVELCFVRDDTPLIPQPDRTDSQPIQC